MKSKLKYVFGVLLFMVVIMGGVEVLGEEPVNYGGFGHNVENVGLALRLQQTQTEPTQIIPTEITAIPVGVVILETIAVNHSRLHNQHSRQFSNRFSLHQHHSLHRHHRSRLPATSTDMNGLT